MTDSSPNSLDRSSPRPASWAWRAGTVATPLLALAVLVGLGFVGMGSREDVRLASQMATHVAELRGTIVNDEDELALLARMGAVTGEPGWAQRFEEMAPKLDAAILEATEIASPEIRATLAETAGEAHRDLLNMERRALELAAGGDLKSGRALLDSAEFGYLHEVYASGLDSFGQQIRIMAEARASDLDRRAWMQAGALGLVAVLLVGMALVLQGHFRLRAAMAHNAVIARTDPLTDLPNRRHFHEQLERALAAGRSSGLDHALILIDLDRFKPVNDAHGHASGDELLRLVAGRLRFVLQDEKRVARLGGDEFAFLLRCDPAGTDHPRSDPADVSRRIVKALGEPFTLRNGAVVQVGASVGIGLTLARDDTIEDLMHRADVALYRAKSAGRGCFRYFEQGTDVRVRALALLEGEFRQAVAEDGIVPHFQPLVEMTTGRVVGVEMLARWPHPTKGMISPGEFIPIAEDSGLIGAMMVNLLRQGCRAAASWPEDVTLACNVSPLQLRDPGLATTLAAVLEETGFPACRLEVEVTESALVGDLALARTLLEQIKCLGVRLALDDFGTGYSSLRHLQMLPFDRLKIDASFVSAMTTDRESSEIVAAVVGLGHSLRMSIVAEGVETEEVAALLRTLGCDVGQGWLFGRPVPAHRIDSLVADCGLGSRAAASLVA